MIQKIHVFLVRWVMAPFSDVIDSHPFDLKGHRLTEIEVATNEKQNPPSAYICFNLLLAFASTTY